MLYKLKRKCRRVNRLLFLLGLLWIILFSAAYINAPFFSRLLWKYPKTAEESADEVFLFEGIKPKVKGLSSRPSTAFGSTLATRLFSEGTGASEIMDEAVSERPAKTRLMPLQREIKSRSSKTVNSKGPCSRVHAFYYPWYGNPTKDGKYLHWNHAVIPHWNTEVAKNYPTGQYKPPEDIGSEFYPQLGPYSSKDPVVIDNHLQYLQMSGIGVVSVSYYPPGMADNEGKAWEEVFDILFDKALKYGIRITFHIEPYTGRTEQSVSQDIVHIIDKYGKHPALFRYSHKKRQNKPLIYIYDSYHISPTQWSTLLDEDTPQSIRNTPYDVIAICLLVDVRHTAFITEGKFDGFYTYFATNGFTYGSTWKNWKYLSDFAREHNCLFIPSIGPGYIDTRIRPWNHENTRDRKHGLYYTNAWLSALKINPELISVTSFNEWHEGTQIEPAVQKTFKDIEYKNYAPNSSYFYLELTNRFVKKFRKCALISNTK